MIGSDERACIMPSNTVWTLGHSTRPIDDFLALLQENNIEMLADVRRFPGSRRYPHFNQENLSASLVEAGICYAHFPALGGRRTARGETTQNSAWRVAAFAAYADYMLTDEFTSAFDELRALAEQSRVAIMCAEAVPWRCHRRMIADQFLAQGWRVLDIIGAGNTKPHELPPFARISNGQVTYPAAQKSLLPDV
jgi:uncharacterized protein (DUF488 family)